MRATVFVLTLLLGLAARADGPSVGVAAGFAAGISPARAAPAIDVSLGLPLNDRWVLGASVSGWTLSAAGTKDAGAEGALAIVAGWRQPLSSQWSVLLLAGPALAVVDRPTQSLELHPAGWFAPALELSTRRKSLSVQLGARALVFEDGLRVGAAAGLKYSFQ